MKTIRAKLILIFTLFIAGLVLLGMVFNIVFLEKYYVYKNKDKFIETYNVVDKTYNNNKNNLQNVLTEIDKIDAIATYIIDKNYNTKYSSFDTKNQSKSVVINKEIQQTIIDNIDSLSDASIYGKIEKKDREESKLIFISKTNKNDLIILTKPIKGIQESVVIANQFYIISGLVMIIIGGIIIAILSKKVTEPIIEISDIAYNISNLNFKKYTKTKTEDEIGNLANSINNISDKLSNNINYLQKDVERRKQLVRNMSHELKTPIGIIQGYAEGLKYGVVENKDEMNEYCDVIVEECNNMDKLIRQLLKISMLESGIYDVNISDFDLNQLLKINIERLRQKIEEKNIKINYKYEDELIIKADYDLVETIIINLLTNSINHTNDEKYIEIKTEKIQNQVKISVFNTGKNIPQNDLQNIWQVFYTSDKSRSKEYSGHGVGLSIVKLAVEIQKGSAFAKNLENGVCFEIYLPK